MQACRRMNEVFIFSKCLILPNFRILGPVFVAVKVFSLKAKLSVLRCS